MYLQAFVIYLQAVDGSAVFLRAVYGDLLLGHLHVPERFSSLFAPWHHGVQRICVFFAVVFGYLLHFLPWTFLVL